MGTPSGTRAAGDVGPYHAQHPARAPGRARRPRRAAHTGTPSGTRAAGDVGPYHAPRPARAPGRARRPRRAAHTGTPLETHTGTRAAGDVGPYHAPHPARAPGRARRPRRATHTGTPSGTPSGTRAAGDVGPTMPRILPAPMVGRDVPGAPRTRERHRGRRPRPSKADGSAEEEVRAVPLNAFVPIDVTTMFEPSSTASRRAKDPRRPRRVASNKSFTPNGKSEHGRGRAPGYLGPIKKSIFINIYHNILTDSTEQRPLQIFSAS